MPVAKLRDIVKQLRDLGHTVETYQRMDIQGRKRGIVIRSIDGTSFKGSKGNEIARQLVGAQLSQYQKEQMERLNKPSNAVNKLPVKKRRKDPLSTEVTKKLRRLQRLYRAKGKEYGLPTTAKYRWNLKNKGKEEADRLLEQAERYVMGLAYDENIEAFLLRLQATSDKLNGALNESIRKISDYPKSKFTEDILTTLINAYYDMLNSPANIESSIQHFNSAVNMILV